MWEAATALAFVIALLAGAAPQRVRAEPALPALATDGLSGGRYVASALDSPRPSLRFAGSAGYGYTENVLGPDDRHHRVAGELAVALLVAPWLQATLGGEFRADLHTPDGPGRETTALGNSRVATRHVLSLGPRMAIGVAPRVLFPGAESPARGFVAASYELAGMFSARLPRDLELSLNAGYRLDRSRLAHRHALELPATQRLSMGLSGKKHACLLGALLVVPLAAYRISAEWSWELLLGGPVHPSKSPMRLRVGLQRIFGERFLPGIELAVDVSSRPEFVGLTRIEPRVWSRLSLAVLLERSAPKTLPKQSDEQVPPAPAPLPAPPRSITLQIVNASGQPIEGALVSMPGDGDGNGETYASGADGRVTLHVPEGVTAATIEAPGFEPVWRALGGEQSESAVVLMPELPVGEIKGLVRNVEGKPLQASVTVLPQGKTVSTDAHGEFTIAVAPGDYAIKVEADGYEQQERQAQVELRGVTIIVIDLRRARP